MYVYFVFVLLLQNYKIFVKEMTKAVFFLIPISISEKNSNFAFFSFRFNFLGMGINIRYLCILILSAVFFLFASDIKAQSLNAKDVVNPKTICGDCFVSDQDNLLSSEIESEINKLLTTLRNNTSMEVAVIALNGESNTSARELSMELFDLWGVGKKGEDNGLIILLCINSGEVFIRTGYGLEGALPDALATQICSEEMLPYFKKGDWGQGLLKGVEAVCGVLYEEYKGNGVSEQEHIDLFPFLLVYLNLCVVFFVAALIFISRKAAKIERNNKLEKINVVKKSAIVWECVGILFLPALIFLLIWLYRIKIRRIRRQNIACHCGGKMKRLSEAQEDKFLDTVKQLEESLGSKDYDVWLCDKCSNTIIYPYEKIFSSYSKCPSCGAKTYKKKYDSVVREPSVNREGLVKTVFECKNCKHREEKMKIIPKEPPVVIVGGIGGNRGGGGFSGGWGGGLSGGGGGGVRF